MGPWSVLASDWMNLPAVYGQRSPSIVYNTGLDVPAHALFLECEDQGEAVSIEVFPRADGSAHVTALSEFAPLPLDPANVRPNQRRSIACKQSQSGCLLFSAVNASQRARLAFVR